MPAQIRLTHAEINDRFPALGFTIRTDGPRRAEVALATHPSLFRAEAKTRRTPSTFFSTRAIGPLRVPGEAAFAIPLEILERFVGHERLYVGLATAPEGNGYTPAVDVLPGEHGPYVSISGLTERSTRRLRLGSSRYQDASGASSLEWAGDTVPVVGAAVPLSAALRGNAGPVPQAAAPHILEFRQTNLMATDPLAFRTSFRDKAVQILRQMEDLGIHDVPPGRRDAYVDAIAWNDQDNWRRGLRSCPTDKNGSCILSSCGLVVRSLWRLLGARDVFQENGRVKHIIDPPYRIGSALSGPLEFARRSGALHDIRTRADLDRANVRPGDAIFMFKGTRQHVLTVVERDGDRIVSIDGGWAGPGDGRCCGIRRVVRTLQPGARFFVGDDRPIVHVATLDRLRFTAPIIELIRHTPVRAQALDAGACPFPDGHPHDFVTVAALHHVRAEYGADPNPTISATRRRMVGERKWSVVLKIGGSEYDFTVQWRPNGEVNVHGHTPPFAGSSCTYSFDCHDHEPAFERLSCIDTADPW